MFSLTPWKKKDGWTSMREREDSSRLSRLREEVETLWDYFWKELDRGLITGMGSGMSQWQADWKETDTDYLFQVELPGFDPTELDVKVAGNVLTVHAEHKEENKSPQGSTMRQGTYHQTMTVPPGVDAERIEANFRNGMLEVRLPKSDQGRGRRIVVQPS